VGPTPDHQASHRRTAAGPAAHATNIDFLAVDPDSPLTLFRSIIDAPNPAPLAASLPKLVAYVQYGAVQVSTTQPDDSGHAQPASMERSGMPLSAASDHVSRG
jgi:hypothetical protein